MPPLLFPSQKEISAFCARLGTQAVGQKLEFHARTRSTNDLAMAAGREGAAHGTTCIADFQEGGRGRRGRAWESPGGLGLLFSIVLRPESLPPAEWGWVPLLTGLACASTLPLLKKGGGFKPTVKWPNDIVVPGAEPPGWRKLGGILCESVLPSSESARGFVIAGVGLNVNHQQPELPSQTKAPPSSLRLELRRTLDRLEVLRLVLQSIEERWLQLIDDSRRAALKREIESCQREWWSADKVLRFESAGGINDGAFAGLDEFGRLRIRDASGKEQVYADAEIVECF
jgi:BirA family biotin operon repressor/biotin-[acetyl-CoA-carboxylase] ligase